MELRKTDWKIIVFVFLGIIVAGGFVIAMYFYYPYHNDWSQFFSPLASHIRNPKEVAGFTNAPWMVFLLLYGLLPIRWSNAINLLLNVAVLLALVRKVKGGWVGILLTFTCPLFWNLAGTNSIDWIPVLGFLLPTAWGLPLMAIKPQTLGMAAFIKWKNTKYRLLPLLPLIVIVIFSFLFWGNWLPSGGLSWFNQVPWNFSFWPISIPFGLYVFYRAFKEGDEVLGAASTPFLMPYIASYSMACLISLLSGKYRKLALALYLFSWWYFIIEYRRLFLAN
jgi:hypothetical protein